MNWLQHFFGFTNGDGNSPAYLFWSGAGSDISEVALIGAVLGAWHKHNCHQPRCWRVGRHTVDGSPWCNRHHEAAREK